MTRATMSSDVPLEAVVVIKACCANVGCLFAFRALNLNKSIHSIITANIAIIQTNFATLIALVVGTVKTKGGSFAVISVIVHRSSCSKS